VGILSATLGQEGAKALLDSFLCVLSLLVLPKVSRQCWATSVLVLVEVSTRLRKVLVM
jgi:hypothetical protein